MFVISGLPEYVLLPPPLHSKPPANPSARRNNEKALFLLYNQLESEKERRIQSAGIPEEDGAQDA